MKRYIIKPGSRIDLSTFVTRDKSAFSGKKKDARKRLNQLNVELEALQELLYAEHKHKILIILQAMDTGGKDGTIRHVFEGVNPQGVRVVSFKVPTLEELDHDYLWRVHKHTPAKGEVVIFNRSHYEDVLVVRVHQLVPEEVWSKRYQQINDFEHMLAEEGTTILKFFLHISQEEQKDRLQARLNEPTKHWKFNSADLKERRLWPKYVQAYQDVLNQTSTEWAPWHVVPADRKWYRNLVIASSIVDTLQELKMKYPPGEADLDKVVIE